MKTTYTKEKLRKEIGAKIKETREKRKLSQAALGNAIGSYPPYISALEKGHTNVEINKLFDVAQALGTTVQSFFT